MATQSIHDVIMAEFGDSVSEDCLGTKTSRKRSVILDIPEGLLASDNELAEVPAEGQDAETPAEA